jgi:Cu/Ag efflux protein CusF
VHNVPLQGGFYRRSGEAAAGQLTEGIMNRIEVVIAIWFGVFLAAGASAQTPPVEAATVYQSTTTTVKIVGLDAPGRVVTVKDKAGDTWSFKVSRDVQNLDQVKVGDSIVVKAFEALVVALKGPKSGPPDAEAVATAVTAAKGQLPAGAEVESVTWQGKIKKIDKKKNTVTLKGPEGNLRTLQVQDPKNLAGVKVGDDIEVTYIEGLAISVEKPAKKGKS